MADSKEKIMVYNKCDLPHDDIICPAGCENIEISAKTGENINQLLHMIESRLFGNYVKAKLLIPYDRGDISSYLCSEATVTIMDYKENGTYFEAELKEADYRRLKKYEAL